VDTAAAIFTLAIDLSQAEDLRFENVFLDNPREYWYFVRDVERGPRVSPFLEHWNFLWHLFGKDN
jgi:hypothetical protein